MKTLTSKPWLHQDGKIFSNERLKTISKDWSAETWEEFLNSTIDRDMSRNEVPISNYEELLDEEVETPRNDQYQLPEQVHSRIHASIRRLTPNQRGVVRGIFFRGLSESEVAKKIKVSQQTINETKKLSLSKIKDFLEKDPVTVVYLIGGSENSDSQNQSREDQILVIYPCKSFRGWSIRA